MEIKISIEQTEYEKGIRKTIFKWTYGPMEHINNNQLNGHQHYNY